MKINLQSIQIMLALALVAYIIYKASSAAESVKEIITEDLNPASDQNIVYGFASGITEAISGIPGDSPADALYRFF